MSDSCAGMTTEKGRESMSTLALETQEAGTGRWFPIVIYSTDNEAARERAGGLAEVLRKVAGLYVRVVGHE